MKIASKPEQLHGNTGDTTRCADRLVHDFEQAAVSLGSFSFQPWAYFADPFEAAVVVWNCEHDAAAEWISELRNSFPAWLADKCGRNPKTLAGDPEKAFDVFMACLDLLLDRWRNEPPLGERYGSSAAHWCVQHPEIYSRVQEAIRARFSQTRISFADWTLDGVIEHGPKGLPQADKLKLTTMLEFSGQRTWTQAARTAAHAVFGDFLISESESTGFCRLCTKPFRIGKKILFCSLKCARNHSARQSREAELRTFRQENLQELAKALASLLRATRVDWSRWPIILQKRSPRVVTRDGRIRKSLGAYIRAAKTEPGSPERKALLRLLVGAPIVSGGKKNSQSREKLQREFESFLSNIQAAERIRERCGRK